MLSPSTNPRLVSSSLLAGSRIPFNFVSVSVCVRISCLVGTFDASLLDEVLGFVNAKSRSWNALDLVTSVSLQQTMSWAAGRLIVAHFSWYKVPSSPPTIFVIIGLTLGFLVWLPTYRLRNRNGSMARLTFLEVCNCPVDSAIRRELFCLSGVQKFVSERGWRSIWCMVH